MSANKKTNEKRKSKKEVSEEKKEKKIQEFSSKFIESKRKFLNEEKDLIANFSNLYADEIIEKKTIIEELSIKMKRFARVLKKLGVVIDIEQIRLSEK